MKKSHKGIVRNIRHKILEGMNKISLPEIILNDQLGNAGVYPILTQVAQKTIGLDLVPVTPLDPPSGTIYGMGIDPTPIVLPKRNMTIRLKKN